MEKKDSIFAGLNPAPAPSSVPGPVPAPWPAGDQEIAALKQKMESLEKNIVASLEKKISEALKASVPAAAHPGAAARQADPDALCRKIEDLERRISDFGQAAALSASQLKNIEESKASARREIGDLLTAVREQQKYSEMDRRMHDQLEKSWARAAELEKKLMEFYSSLLAMEAKRREESFASSEKSAAAAEALSERLAGLEEKISALAAQPAAAELRRAQEEFFSRAEGERRAAAEETVRALREQAALSAQKTEEFVKLAQAGILKAEEVGVALEASARRRVLELEEFFSRAEGERRAAVEEIRGALREQAALSTQKTAEFENLAQAGILKAEEAETALEACARRRVMELEEFFSRAEGERRAAAEETVRALREQAALLLAEKTEEFEKLAQAGILKAEGERRAAAEETVRTLREQAALLSAEKTAEFEKLAQAGILKAEGAQTALETSACRRVLELEELARRLEADLRNKSADYAAAAKKENDERFEKFGAEYADALLSAAFMECFRSGLGCAVERLEFSQARLRDLLKDVPPEQLEKLMGVSGMLVRKKFEALASTLETLGVESRLLREIKRGIEERFKDIFGSR
ncbi:MAG: hypothetical protein HY796_00200 [Elusimicrobia bacterium]|nr:hypothetical protein [Elusimicrobiota bacterium]